MKITNEIRAKKVAEAINKVRSILKTEFATKDEIVKMLSENGCYYPSSVFTILREKNILWSNGKRNGKKFKFNISEPVYFKSIMQELSDISKSRCDAVAKATSQKQQHSMSCKRAIDLLSEEGYTVVYPDQDEETLIQALKAKGYRILKPVVTTDYKEC